MAPPRTFVFLALTVCCLAAAVLAEPQNSVIPHDNKVPVGLAVGASSTQIIIGECRRDDSVLLVQTVRKSAKWLQVRHELVSYPAADQRGGVISCINLQSLKDANHGTAIIQSGGPGLTSVEIKASSERGHSLAWSIVIYGSPAK